MVEEMFSLTTAIALRSLFSTRLDAAEAGKLREAFEVFLRGSYTQIALPRCSAASRCPPTAATRRRCGSGGGRCGS
jgi:hypothetical protein